SRARSPAPGVLGSTYSFPSHSRVALPVRLPLGRKPRALGRGCRREQHGVCESSGARSSDVAPRRRRNRLGGIGCRVRARLYPNAGAAEWQDLGALDIHDERGRPTRRCSGRGFAPPLNASNDRQHERASGTESRVSPQTLFGTCVALSFVAWGIIAAQYLWPALRSQPRAHALRPLLLLHSFRFIGLAFLVPGVVSPDLPGAFARPAA